MQSTWRHHIVALSRDLTLAMATRTAAGWLLPINTKTRRAKLPEQIRALLQPFTSHTQLIHEAPLAPSLFSLEEDYYFVATVDPAGEENASLQAVPVDELLQQRPVIAEQRDALVTALARQRAPAAPFDTREQVADAWQWAIGHATQRLRGKLTTAAPHRCGRRDYVGRVVTTAGTAYFKGGPTRWDEAVLTQLLWTASPHQFPCSLAGEPDRQRWLYRELDGHPLVGPRLTPRNAEAAVRALAILQRRVRTDGPIEAHLAAQRLDARGIFARADQHIERTLNGTPARLTALEQQSASRQDATPSRMIRNGLKAERHDPPDHARSASSLLKAWRCRKHQIEHVCADLDALDVPLSLTLSDFWGPNLLETPNGVGFIDLEYAYWSCPWLSLFRFVRDAREAWGSTHTDHLAARVCLYESYVEEWAPVVSPAAMRKALAELPLLGQLFSILLVAEDLDRYDGEMGLPDGLPAWYRAARLKPFIARLLQTTEAASPSHADEWS